MSEIDNGQSKTVQLMLILASFVIVVAGMKAAEPIVVPFLLSVFISIIALPPFVWLQQKKIPRGIALGIIILSFLIFIFLIGLLIGTSINDFSSRLPLYEEKLQNQTQEIISWLKERKMVESDFQIDSWFNPAVILNIVGDVFNQVSSLFTNGFLILLIVVFILLEAASLPTKIKKMYANPDASLTRIQSVIKNINKYIALKTVLNLLMLYWRQYFYLLWVSTVFKNKRYLPATLLETARGCLHDCAFCAVTAFSGREHRCRPVEEVIVEIEGLGKDFVFFVDDNIIGNHRSCQSAVAGLDPLEDSLDWAGWLNHDPRFGAIAIDAKKRVPGSFGRYGIVKPGKLATN